MRITWVGVPKAARKDIRAKIREDISGDEFLVCSEKGRDQKARQYCKDSAWAFRPEFIASQARVSLGGSAIKALGEAQGKLCESANELVLAMVRFSSFWREAVKADGYGCFLAPHDDTERDVKVNGVRFYIYRQN